MQATTTSRGIKMVVVAVQLGGDVISKCSEPSLQTAGRFEVLKASTAINRFHL
jgi:hypothetical protein